MDCVSTHDLAVPIMISQFRPSTPADAGSIAQLLRQVFGIAPDHPGLDPRQMDWKYWRKYPDWTGSRSFVMEREGRVTAHIAAVPLTCLWGDRRFTLLHMMDWAAQPDATGAGIAVLKKAEQLADGVFIAEGSEMTQKLLPALGFRDSAKATKFALPLRPLARLFDDSFNSWRPAARYARNVVWALKAPSSAPGWSARRVAQNDLAGVRIPMAQVLASTALFERTVPRISDLLDCPATPAMFYLVERDGSPCGYFILTMAVKQCRIAEAWVEPGEANDWRELYILASREARAHRHIAEIATVGSTAVEVLGLQQAGFQARGEIHLRFHLRGGGIPKMVRYLLADGDAAYFHDGRSDIWA